MQHGKKTFFKKILLILSLVLCAFTAFPGIGGRSSSGSSTLQNGTSKSSGRSVSPRAKSRSKGHVRYPGFRGKCFSSGHGISTGGFSSGTGGIGIGIGSPSRRTKTTGSVSILTPANPDMDNSGYSITSGLIRYTPGRLEIEEKTGWLYRTPRGTLREGKTVWIYEVLYDPGAVAGDSMKKDKYEEQHKKCAICKKKCKLNAMVGEYIMPLSAGGKAISANLLMLCKKCAAKYGDTASK